MGAWDTQGPLKGIGWSPQIILARSTFLLCPYGKILTIVVSVFLDSFPNFKLLSLCVEVRGSAWWLMQQSSRSSLCQNVSEKQVAGISINSPALHYIISFISSLLLRDMDGSFCVCVRAHTCTHTFWGIQTQLVINYLWIFTGQIESENAQKSESVTKWWQDIFAVLWLLAKTPNFMKVFHKLHPPKILLHKAENYFANSQTTMTIGQWKFMELLTVWKETDVQSSPLSSWFVRQIQKNPMI